MLPRNSVSIYVYLNPPWNDRPIHRYWTMANKADMDAECPVVSDSLRNAPSIARRDSEDVFSRMAAEMKTCVMGNQAYVSLASNTNETKSYFERRLSLKYDLFQGKSDCRQSMVCEPIRLKTAETNSSPLNTLAGVIGDQWGKTDTLASRQNSDDLIIDTSSTDDFGDSREVKLSNVLTENFSNGNVRAPTDGMVDNVDRYASNMEHECRRVGGTSSAPSSCRAETASVPSHSPGGAASSPVTSSSWPSSPVFRSRSASNRASPSESISASRRRLHQFSQDLSRDSSNRRSAAEQPTNRSTATTLTPSVSCQRLKYAVSSRLVRTLTPPPTGLTTPPTEAPITQNHKPTSLESNRDLADPFAFIVTGNCRGRFGLHRTRSLYMPTWSPDTETGQSSQPIDTHIQTPTDTEARLGGKSTRGRQIRPKSFHGGDILRFGSLLRGGYSGNETFTNSCVDRTVLCVPDEVTRVIQPSHTTASLVTLHQTATSLTLSPTPLAEAANGSVSTLEVITAYLEQLRMRGSKEDVDVQEGVIEDPLRSAKCRHSSSSITRSPRTKLTELTTDKLAARSKDDILILLQSFYQQIQVVSEELVVILQLRHDLREQVEMRRVAIEQLLRLHTDPALQHSSPFKDLHSPPSLQRNIMEASNNSSSQRGSS